MNYKSCGNCKKEMKCIDYMICSEKENFPLWEQLQCEFCGGSLSEIRYHNGKPYRHCYGCHFDRNVEEGQLY